MKRLAVFLNGTWNDIDDNTDVRRLRSPPAEQGLEGVRFHRTIGEPD